MGKALAKVSREVCMDYFDLKKEHLQTVVEQAHQVDTLIVANCKVEVIELSHYECPN
jgi:ferredoxin